MAVDGRAGNRKSTREFSLKPIERETLGQPLMGRVRREPAGDGATLGTVDHEFAVYRHPRGAILPQSPQSTKAGVAPPWRAWRAWREHPRRRDPQNHLRVEPCSRTWPTGRSLLRIRCAAVVDSVPERAEKGTIVSDMWDCTALSDPFAFRLTPFRGLDATSRFHVACAT